MSTESEPFIIKIKNLNGPCLNWWPNVSTSHTFDPLMPNPLCAICANWKLTDIEDIFTLSKSGNCYNRYNHKK